MMKNAKKKAKCPGMAKHEKKEKKLISKEKNIVGKLSKMHKKY
jgi:hypothetical protein